MKVLWVVNTVLPKIAADCGIESCFAGGWLTGIADSLSENENIDLTVCFPYNKGFLSGRIGRIGYYSFETEGFYIVSKKTESRFVDIIGKQKPDIIHIFGTEYPHSLSALTVAEKNGLLKKTVVSIQGLVSVYAKHFFAGLPENALSACTLRDFLRHDNIRQQKLKYELRGRFETATLKKAKNVIGRTDWDEACVKAINDEIDYYFCDETLRSEFYSGMWEYEKCEKHSVFLGSSAYPIKGLHCVLDIFPQILKKYPDAKLYVTGSNPLQKETIVHRTYYRDYLKELILKNRIENNVVFLGSLSAIQMKERMLSSNVFILPSSIENSPNTLGEAMILGLPCIAADVGGVRNMAIDKKDVLLYPFDENYMLPYYVGKIFGDIEFAKNLSSSARAHASATHSKKKNNDVLLNIYKKIIQMSD